MPSQPGNSADPPDDSADVNPGQPEHPGKGARPAKKPPAGEPPGAKKPSTPKKAQPAQGAPRKTAQERLAEQREANKAARQAAARRRKALRMVLPVVLVLVVVAVLVVVKVATGAGSPKSGVKPSAAASAVVTAVTSLPAATFDTVGLGSITTFPISAGNAPALTQNGLPRVFYAGAEYCPYCAAERWPVVIALSRFGTWSDLGQTASSPSDVFPNTATFSFHGASFSGSTVAFSGYELESNQVSGGKYAPLDTLSPADQALMQTYDAPPYFSTSGAIPFIDIGGRYLVSGSSFNPQLLAGKTQAQIADALTDVNSPITKAIVGAANVVTAAVCKLTSNAPAAVCTSSGVQAAAAKLPNAG